MPVEFSGRPQIEGSRRFAEQCQDEAAKGFSIEVLQNLRPRVPSSGYWASAAWDPDCRVYAGAEIFQTHNLAEQQDQQKQEWPKQQKQQDQQDQQAEHAPMRRVRKLGTLWYLFVCLFVCLFGSPSLFPFNVPQRGVVHFSLQTTPPPAPLLFSGNSPHGSPKQKAFIGSGLFRGTTPYEGLAKGLLG